jgi:hypothetical protein
VELVRNARSEPHFRKNYTYMEKLTGVGNFNLYVFAVSVIPSMYIYVCVCVCLHAYCISGL